MDLFIPFGVMVILMLLNVPIAFAMGLAGILGIWIITGDLGVLINILGTTPFNMVANYTLTTIPMFILMAFLASEGGLANNVYDAASKWVSHLRGGLGIASIFATMIFGAMSGVASAAASVMSKVALPQMRRFGYSEVLASGIIAVASTTDVLIPPSVGFVIYGIVTETSISKLFIAGVIPGVLVCVLLSLCVLVWVTIRPQDAPKASQAEAWVERWRSLFAIWPSLLLILFVLVALYTGIATPTEVGAIGAFVAGVIGLIIGCLTWTATLRAFKEAIRISTMIFLILIGAAVFGYYVTLSQMPQSIMTFVTEMNVNRYIVIICIITCYFIISMFMDELPLLLLVLQIAFPLVLMLGFDPIWFGVICMLMISMGLIFPPVAIVCFVVASTGNVELIKVYKGTYILVIALILATILIIFFPEIALWLPSMM